MSKFVADWISGEKQKIIFLNHAVFQLEVFPHYLWHVIHIRVLPESVFVVDFNYPLLNNSKLSITKEVFIKQWLEIQHHSIYFESTDIRIVFCIKYQLCMTEAGQSFMKFSGLTRGPLVAGPFVSGVYNLLPKTPSLWKSCMVTP